MVATFGSVEVILFCDLVPVGEIIVDAITGECDLLSRADIEAGYFDQQSQWAAFCGVLSFLGARLGARHNIFSYIVQYLCIF